MPPPKIPTGRIPAAAATATLPAWLTVGKRLHDGNVEYRVALHAKPGARSNSLEFVGSPEKWSDSALEVRIAAPPVEGQANAALVVFFEDEVLPKSCKRVALSSGSTSRNKQIEFTSVDDPSDIARAIIAFASAQ